MLETIENQNIPPTNPSESDHLIQSLVEKEDLNVVSPAPEMQISSGQLLMVDCRVSTPEQVMDWHTAKPKGTPFLLLSPEEEHLAPMASVCIINPTEAQYAVLYEITTDGGTCVTALAYSPVREGEETVAKIEPAADCEATEKFIEAVRRSLESPIKLDEDSPVVIGPQDPPEGMICLSPYNQFKSIHPPITFKTSRQPVEDGLANNKSATSFIAYYTPYVFLQQLDNGTDNSQFLIIKTEWDIIAGDLYANDNHDRGNAQCNMVGTLQPDPNSPFMASPPPNDFSPKSSTGNGSIDASIDETIYYYDSGTSQTLGYEFKASATYDIVDWAVSSNCNGTALGPNFYATQPTNCENYLSELSFDAFDNKGKIHDLPPDSCSGGELTFWTFSSWQTKNNALVTGLLKIDSEWNAIAYRWYTDTDSHPKMEYYYSDNNHLSDGFTVDFSSIQPSG